MKMEKFKFDNPLCSKWEILGAAIVLAVVLSFGGFVVEQVFPQSRIDPATQIQGGTQIVEWFDCQVPEGCQGLYQITVEHSDGSRSGPYVIVKILDGIDYARDEPDRWSERDLTQ